MISTERVLDLVGCCLGRDLRIPDNGAVMYSSDSILEIVAGPGSGRTTVPCSAPCLMVRFRKGCSAGEHSDHYLYSKGRSRATDALVWGTEDIDGYKGGSPWSLPHRRKYRSLRTPACILLKCPKGFFK